MSQTQENQSEKQKKVIDELITLVRRSGDTETFWNEFIDIFSRMCSADKSILLGMIKGEWKIAKTSAKQDAAWFGSILAETASEALKKNLAASRINNETFLAVKLDAGSQESPPVLVMKLFPNATVPNESLLYFASLVPSLYQSVRQYKKARGDVVFFAKLLQIVSGITSDRGFLLAVMRLCNESSALFKCDQVSFGWVTDGSVRLKAISNMESFEYRAKSVIELEAAMDECLDEDAETVWPSASDPAKLRAHSAYAGVKRIGSLVSLPVRSGDKVIGVLTCEREKGTFSEDEIWRIRLLLEQTGRWLEYIEGNSAWMLQKAYRKLKNYLKNFSKTEKTAQKTILITVISVVLIMSLPIYPYNVDGTFILKADKTAHISAPLDGFIEKAYVKPGDYITKGTKLVSMDGRTLLMEQASAAAKLSRFTREAEKAVASGSLADMRIAELMAEETAAEMDIISFKMDSISMKAPFNGVVTEGDLRAKLGASVRQGDVLMKVARLEDVFFEILINEKDIYYFNIKSKVRVKFLGKPNTSYRADVTQIVPQALEDNGSNVFTVYAAPKDMPEQWWRPGMSGEVKIDAGYKSTWWVISHEAIDYLRLKFWL